MIGRAFAYTSIMYREQEFQFVYEHGVLRPEGRLDLPEGARGIAHIREVNGAAAGFWATPTIDELRRQQGTLPVRRVEELAGDWPADDSLDEFLDSVRRGRA
jgi:predicted DNA-binding antitoxin AbrB/MazE fold protein